MWEVKVTGSGCLHCVDDGYTFAQVTSTTSGSFLHNINMERGTGLGGHSDWRLPNIRELMTIVDYSRFSPAIDPAFTPTATVSYWSSTTAVSDPSQAFGVDFANGNVFPSDKNGRPRVRAVRGGQ